MTSKKLIARLASNPSDFRWAEALKVLEYKGYHQLKTGRTGGSRRKFINKDGNIISLHEPHPDKILKKYVIKLLRTKLNI